MRELSLNLEGGEGSLGCYVDVDRTCRHKREAPWEAANPILREYLYLSDAVQKNMRGCIEFGNLIKTECQLLEPITTIFYGGDDVLEEINISVAFDDKMKANSQSLPQAFQDYFLNCDKNGTESKIISDGQCKACMAGSHPVVDDAGVTHCRTYYRTVGYFNGATTEIDIIPTPWTAESGGLVKLLLRDRLPSYVYGPEGVILSGTIDLLSISGEEFDKSYASFLPLYHATKSIGPLSTASPATSCRAPLVLVENLDTGITSCRIQLDANLAEDGNPRAGQSPGILSCGYKEKFSGTLVAINTRSSNWFKDREKPTCYQKFFVSEVPTEKFRCPPMAQCTGDERQLSMFTETRVPLTRFEIEKQYVNFRIVPNHEIETTSENINFTWNSLGASYKYSLDVKDVAGVVHKPCINANIIMIGTQVQYSGYCPHSAPEGTKPAKIAGAKICASNDNWATSTCSKDWMNPRQRLTVTTETPRLYRLYINKEYTDSTSDDALISVLAAEWDQGQPKDCEFSGAVDTCLFERGTTVTIKLNPEKISKPIKIQGCNGNAETMTCTVQILGPRHVDVTFEKL